MERVNGEIIAGSALAFLAILFIYAAQVNPIWAVALPADYILLAVGLATIGLGIWTRRNTNRMHSHEEHPHGRH
ncbi:MAG: hypothetical protein AB1753_08765 [Thermoproteota archaeon]